MSKKDDKYYLEKGKKAEQLERRFYQAVKGLPTLQRPTDGGRNAETEKLGKEVELAMLEAGEDMAINNLLDEAEEKGMPYFQGYFDGFFTGRELLGEYRLEKQRIENKGL